MSRLGRLLGATVGVWVLLVTAGAALAGYRVAETLVASGDLFRVAAFALVLALVFGYASYRFGAKRLLRGVNAAPVTRAEAPTVHACLDRLAERMDVSRPDLYVARVGQPNAFALGNGVIVVDRSLARLLAPDELEAILAHELAHIEGHDSLVRTLAYSLSRTAVGLVLFTSLPVLFVLTGTSLGLSLVFGRPLTGPESVGYRARRLGIRTLAVAFVAPTAALRAYSRRREYAADDRAISVIDDPLSLARALGKLERATEPGFGVLSFLFPSRRKRDRERSPLERAFATHPPTAERIERVRETAAARDRERWSHIEIS